MGFVSARSAPSAEDTGLGPGALQAEPGEVADEEPAQVAPANSVVYYLGDPASQLVKIGTTTKLRQRLRTIRQRGWPRAVILATEPGGHAEEHVRHLEFRRFRAELGTTEREWFYKDVLLMKHVNETRHRYGILCPGWPVDFSMIARLRRH